jgi:hypothetical protein
MRVVALGRPAASVDELPIAPRYLRADLASNQCHVRFWHFSDIPTAPTNVRCWGKADIDQPLLTYDF